MFGSLSRDGVNDITMKIDDVRAVEFLQIAQHDWLETARLQTVALV